MERSKLSVISTVWKRWFEAKILVMLLILGLFVEVSSRSKQKCPVSSSGVINLYAYPGSSSYNFQYTYNPLFDFKTDIDLIDDFLKSDDEVRCQWEIKAKENHYAAISFPQFQLLPLMKNYAENEIADCVEIYSGKQVEKKFMEEICGGDIPKAEYRSEDRYLFVVYRQGEKSGKRSFNMDYQAIPYPRDFIVRIAAIVSGSVAGVGLLFLGLKFSRCCRPCRRCCCPDTLGDDHGPEVTTRELQPLTPAALVPPSVSRTVDENERNEQRAAGVNGGRGVNGREQGVNAGVRGHRRVPEPVTPAERSIVGVGEEPPSPGPDEPPPSYDSIFGEGDNPPKPD